MKDSKIYCSAKIIYEISEESGEYSLEVYQEGLKYSENPDYYCRINNITNEKNIIEKFAEFLSLNCAMPIHIPELTEAYLM